MICLVIFNQICISWHCSTSLYYSRHWDMGSRQEIVRTGLKNVWRRPFSGSKTAFFAFSLTLTTADGRIHVGTRQAERLMMWWCGCRRQWWIRAVRRTLRWCVACWNVCPTGWLRTSFLFSSSWPQRFSSLPSPHWCVIPRLHEEAYMKQTWSKRIQYTRARCVL